MRFLALISLLGLALLPAFTQTTKPKTGAAASTAKKTSGKTTSTAKPKPTPKKSTTTTAAKPKPKPSTAKPTTTHAATTSKPKTGATATKKPGSSAANTTSKPAGATVKKPAGTTTTAKTPAATKPKPKPAAGQSTAAKTPITAKPKLVATPPKPDEKTEWDKASSVTDTLARISALQKFNEAFPKSMRLSDSLALIAATRGQLGNEKMVAGDLTYAAAYFRAAVSDAPKPIPDQLFTESFAKFPANLYFRGAQSEAFEIAKLIEDKADASAPQLLNLATFYMSIENGAEARRVTEKAIVLDPNSSSAYQTLGLANRIDFQLDESAVAYAKALQLEPDSLSARRGLAEMKRSLGKADEAVTLYREILAKDEANLPAQTGLVLALFDAEKRTDAEAELAKSLTANPGNVILLAGTAYWYAAHNEGAKAVEFAQKSIAADPRFIWSHIALARGLIVQKKPIEAEKALLLARQYGNFPTLEYEIASARLAAGFYREAAEELAKNFSVKDGIVHTNLGGRVPRDNKNITELVGPERRASIFAPTAADDPENAAQMTALLELKQQLDSPTPNADTAAKAADAFVRGEDKMKVHRQIYAANQLLDKKIALPKVVEIAKATVNYVDPGLEVPFATSAVMANELYESRAIAAARGDYVNVPDVARSTLSAILRGRVEEINGWALYEMDNPTESVVRLRRAVSVLPVDSAWWRSGMWRLGSALALSGKDADALDVYIKCYKSAGTPDGVRYGIIEALYGKVNGSTMGLETKIGAKPAPVAAMVQKPQPTPAFQSKVETPAETKTDPVPAATPESKIDTPKTEPKTTPDVKIGALATVRTEPTVTATPAPTPADTTVQKTEPTPTPETKIETPPQPTATPEVKIDVPKTEPTPADTAVQKTEPRPTPEVKVDTPAENKTVPITTATPEAKLDAPKTEPTPSTSPEVKTEQPKPTPEATPDASKPTEEMPKESTSDSKPGNTTKELFPPVVISIPTPVPGKLPSTETVAKNDPSPTDVKPVNDNKPAATTEKKTDPAPPETKAADDNKPAAPPENKSDAPPMPSDQRPRIVDAKPETTAEIKPCKITASEESLTINNGGSDLAVIIGLEGDGTLDGLTATSSSPKNISVRRQSIEGMTSRAIFVVKSISPNTGIYQVTFEMPCGKKEVLVKIR